MSELKLQKVFVPVSDSKAALQIKINNEWCTLKEQEGYFFSKDELEKLLAEAYDAGADIDTFYNDYIKQLNL